ncbi:unnamed protein product [Closterium sp. NIES-64]|nr:unnamed protein product [Closterium sp. NIES-64]
MQLPEFIQRHGAKDKREMKAEGVDGEGNPVTFEFTLHERPLPRHETEGDVTACVELSIKYVRAIDKELEWRMRDLEDTGADTDVPDDDFEEIISESDSDADSADYKRGSDEDEEDSDGGEDGSGDERITRPSKKEQRAPASRNKR